MAKIGIVIASVREGRFADKVTAWFEPIANAYQGLEFELLDLKDYPLPFFAEKAPPAYAPVENEVAKRWQAKLDEMDGFVIITAEYNRGPTAAIKNAFDYAYTQWNNKPIAFVGYGSAGGARAVEQLRLNAIELQMAPIRAAVHIPGPVFVAVMQGQQQLNDHEHLADAAGSMLDQLAWWTSALTTARSSAG